MWAITNNTPFATERTWVRDKDGAEIWLVAVKATFDFNLEGRSKLAEHQEEVKRSIEFFGDPDKTGLKFDTDFAIAKPNTDVIVTGHAYAPDQLAIPTSDVTLRVADINKTLMVYGDRFWQKTPSGFTMTDPEPFLKIPLVYDRAFGGVDVRSDDDKEKGYEAQNPVGTGFVMLEKHLDGCPIANFEYPESEIKKWEDRPKPAGLAPIARHWEPRVNYAGTYDEKWEEEQQPLLPEDYEDQFQQQAPSDQQVKGYLIGGEFVELINLTVNGYAHFQLPKITFGFKTNFSDGSTQRHNAKLHTLLVKPDVQQYSIVWLSELPCHSQVNKLLNTKISIEDLALIDIDEEVA